MNSYHLQLRRVTWWTRKSVLEPDLTDDEDFEDDEEPEPIDPDAPSECRPRAQCKQCSIHVDNGLNDCPLYRASCTVASMTSDPLFPSEPTLWTRVKNAAMGKSTEPKVRLTKEQKEEIREKMTNIDEEPFWSTVCDVNAVIAVALTCFIIGFYA